MASIMDSSIKFFIELVRAWVSMHLANSVKGLQGPVHLFTRILSFEWDWKESFVPMGFSCFSSSVETLNFLNAIHTHFALFNTVCKV